MTPYEQSVTILARFAILATFVVLVGMWLLALWLRGFYAFRAWRRSRRHGGMVDLTGFWPPRSERWFR